MLLCVANIGGNLKYWRELRGFTTQRSLARKIGIDSTRLSDWENGRYPLPEIRNLLVIAKALDVSIDDLLLGFDAEYDAQRAGGRPVAPPTTPPPVLQGPLAETLIALWNDPQLDEERQWMLITAAQGLLTGRRPVRPAQARKRRPGARTPQRSR